MTDEELIARLRDDSGDWLTDAAAEAQIAALTAQVERLTGALRKAEQDFYEAANRFQDEDYEGPHEKFTVNVVCHIKPYFDMNMKHLRDSAAAARAALALTDAPNLKRIGTGLYETQPTPDPAAIREAWEKAYWRMRSYAIHDNDCKLNKPPHFNGPCSCGLTAALEEALALISKGATEPTEYERKVAQMKKDFPNGI